MEPSTETLAPEVPADEMIFAFNLFSGAMHGQYVSRRVVLEPKKFFTIYLLPEGSPLEPGMRAIADHYEDHPLLAPIMQRLYSFALLVQEQEKHRTPGFNDFVERERISAAALGALAKCKVRAHDRFDPTEFIRIARELRDSD
jgi:hypothetical protein